MKFKENLINFRLFGEDDNGDEWFVMILKNDKKDELLVEDVWEELSEYIVRIEIIDFEEEKQRSEKIFVFFLYIERLFSNDNQVVIDIKLLLIWE